jgi:hypothetical protein
MGYSPKIWGKEGWHLIHFVALNYPEKPTEEDKKNYKTFYEMLQHTLPCEGCSYNWGLKMKEHPPKLDNREELVHWTIDMHNFVNKGHGKKELEYEKAIKLVFAKRYREIIKDSAILSVGLISTILFLSYRFTRK